MKIEKTIEILEALASGCSPLTGEVINHDSVLNEREVIRALESAISKLEDRISTKANSSFENSVLEITENDANKAIELFQSIDYNPTYSRLTHFFLKSKQFDYPLLNTNELYGKYFGSYTQKEMHTFFKKHLTENGLSLHGKVKKKKKIEPWDDIDFFKQEKFNTLNEKAIDQLKSKITDIGVLKTEDLSEYIIKSRQTYTRAYENWSDTEKLLLEKALKYTNDLELLSECFQRGPGSIKSCGKRLIYESQQNADNQE